MIFANANRLVYGSAGDAIGPSLVDCLETIGWARFPQTQVHGLVAHAHDIFEICFIEDGMVTWWAGDERYDVRRGDIFYTRPYELHGGVDTMMHVCELYWLQIRADSVTHELLNALYPQGPRCFPSLETGSLFAQLHQEHQRQNPFASVAARAILQQLLVSVVRARMMLQQPRLPSPSILAAMAWMQDRLSLPFAIQEAASAVHMHPSRFYERFLAEVGQTPAEWRVHQRIGKAQTLLSEEDTSVTDIALSLGFSTPQSFATAFKRYTGHTPTEYRRMRTFSHQK